MVSGSNPLAATFLSPLALRLRRQIRQHALWPPRNARLLIGVSGGPDSMALLALLAELRRLEALTLSAAYIDHRWRPAAARRELALVRRVGRRLKVPVVTASLAPGKRARQSWEGTARQQRYHALLRLARRRRAGFVAVAHTLDDQAETLLLALGRGSGLTGAGGMPPARALEESGVRLVRPLLTFRREDLVAYLRQRRLPWAVDATNARLAFLRNRLRHAVMPALTKTFGPSVIERLAAFTEVARDENDWVQQQIAAWCRRHVRAGRGVARVSAPVLQGQPVAAQRRIVRWMAGRVAGSLRGITSRHVAACLWLAARRRRGRLDWPRGMAVEVTSRAVTVRGRPSRRGVALRGS